MSRRVPWWRGIAAVPLYLALLGLPCPGRTEESVANDSETEVVRERYPTGAVKIEREMAQDSQGDYILHGNWSLFAPDGAVLARGPFEKGVRVGLWMRFFKGDESPIFTRSPYKEAQGPFQSQATFESGQLHGKWTITDVQGRKLSEIPFRNGQRSGLAVWWFANGARMQEIGFHEGAMDGAWREWDSTGKLIAEGEFHDGRQPAEPKVSLYKNGQKRSEEGILAPPLVLQTPDDWWTARLALYAPKGNESKHGQFTSWHLNGAKKSQGAYENNLPEGVFTWWHDTGEKSLEGSYQCGKPSGVWTWWHANGQKATAGEYKDGVAVGKWSWWGEDGRLLQDTEVAITPPESSDPTLAGETAVLPEETTPLRSVLKR